MNYIETERRHFILLYQGNTIFSEWIVPSKAYLVAYTVDRIYMNKVISHDYYQDDITSLIEDICEMVIARSKPRTPFPV